MAYTTNQLISGAYYASGVVSRDFETVSGSQVADGLGWLNDIITEKVVDESMVPYESTLTMDFQTDVSVYPIPNLIKIDTLVFYLDQVRYPMQYSQRNAYFGTGRADNIQSLPFEWYFERQLGGGNLHIYFKPDRDYPMEIHGIFRLETVVLGQDLSLSLDEFYITYLRYALADRICSEYQFVTPTNVMRQLNKYESFISSKSRLLDLSMTKVSTLNQKAGFNWAFVNLGKGWSPS